MFSFYGSKMMTTGYGGMVVSKNKKLADKARDYRQFDHRRTYYPRFNFMMSDINAALGLTQLEQFPTFMRKRRLIYDKYIEICYSKGWKFQQPAQGCLANCYEFVLRMPHKTIQRLKKHLWDNGIDTVIPIQHYELLHNYLHLDKSKFPVAEELSRTTLALPIYPKMVDTKSYETVLKALRGF